GPSSVFSIVTTAVVLISSGLISALVNCAESAIVKQPACAAAISSSGFVPAPFSNRVLKLYCASLRTPLCVLMLPLPSFNPPRHPADALPSIMSLLGSSDARFRCHVKMRDTRRDMRHSNRISFLESRFSSRVQIDEPQQEEHSQHIQHPVLTPSAPGRELQQREADDAEREPGRDGVGQRNREDGEERRNCNARLLPVDARGAAHHQRTNQDQRR